MNIDVEFAETTQNFSFKFGEINNISDGGYERGYEDGYVIGNHEGYTKGHEDGVTDGYADGYDTATKQSKGVLDMFLTGNTIGQGYVESDVTSLRSYTFYGTGVVYVNLPNVETIGSRCFYECRSLENIYFPNLTGLSGYDFRYCVNLQQVDFPKVEIIGSYSFAACTVLKTLILRIPKVCTLSSDTALSNTPIDSGTGYVYVPKVLVEQYKTATNWSNYADQIRAIEDYPEICG